MDGKYDTDMNQYREDRGIIKTLRTFLTAKDIKLDKNKQPISLFLNSLNSCIERYNKTIEVTNDKES